MSGARRIALGATVVALVALSFAVGYAAHRTSPPTTTSTSTTSAPAPTWMAIWPSADGAVRYVKPTAAALGFARHVLMMTSARALTFQQGDTRSGEVPIITTDQGPLTTVLVRQLGPDDSWWVLAAISSDLEITRPSSLSTVSSPLKVSGHSTAFEGVINVSLYQDGDSTPLISTTTTGGSMGVLAPYSVTLTFARPRQPYGVLVVDTLSAQDGSVLEASALRVAFAR